MGRMLCYGSNRNRNDLSLPLFYFALVHADPSGIYRSSAFSSGTTIASTRSAISRLVGTFGILCKQTITAFVADVCSDSMNQINCLRNVKKEEMQ
jgi:hypothetical protein